MFTKDEIAYIVMLLLKKRELEQRPKELDGIDKEIQNGKMEYQQINYLFSVVYKLIGGNLNSIDKVILKKLFAQLKEHHQINWTRTEIFDVDNFQNFPLQEMGEMCESFDHYSVYLYLTTVYKSGSLLCDDYIMSVIEELYPHISDNLVNL